MENENKLKRQYEYIFGEIKVSELVATLLGEINRETLPLFDLWQDTTKVDYMVTFNSVRVIMPILESASLIEFSKNPLLLLERLNVPEPKISWFMFRHGLFHGTRPFLVEYKGEKYNWGIKQYLGVHHIGPSNTIMISARQLLNDLIKYLEQFKYESRKIKIQTGVRFLDSQI